jgi:hypothetical protein
VRHGGGQHQAVAILVLQTFTHEGGATGGSAHEEAAGAGIIGQPDEVSYALESEHGIERVERNHRHAAGVVRGTGRNPRGERARLRDAFLQQLTVGSLAVRQQKIVIDRLVLLALAGVNTDLTEQRIHTEGAGLIGNDRHDALADCLVTAQVAQQAGERHGGGHSLRTRPGLHLGEGGIGGQAQRAANRG